MLWLGGGGFFAAIGELVDVGIVVCCEDGKLSSSPESQMGIESGKRAAANFDLDVLRAIELHFRFFCEGAGVILIKVPSCLKCR